MNKVLFSALFITLSLLADHNTTSNIDSTNSTISDKNSSNSDINTTAIELQKELEERKKAEQEARLQRELAQALENEKKEQVLAYKKRLLNIKEALTSLDSIWLKSYQSYQTYKKAEEDLKNLKTTILALRNNENNNSTEIDALLAKEDILNHQMKLLKGDSSAPFSTLLEPSDIGKVPEINNPLDVFSGFSYIKRLNQKLEAYSDNRAALQDLIHYLREYKKNVRNLEDLGINLKNDDKLLIAAENLDKFELALDTVQSAETLYQNRIRDIKLEISASIEKQTVKLFNIGIVILVLFVIFFLVKSIIKRYITDNERFYMANKILTFANFSLIIIILLFSYIENVSYLVTVLGFASAGIAIAMKDWFMSMLGWLVIVFGGSIHVGDRIRVDMDGMQYVGDVLDVSLLRITLLEDITLTTYRSNRRAGRILFIPNNYVFTRMIANYTHSSLKTVWDGIDVTITFDSNHKKAIHIAKEITRKYAKGYTDITRKQLNKLRNQYNLKNSNVEPRIFSFIEENGLRISAWYLTNAYATLTLRSSISMEIIDAFQSENDITIAYPTQKIHFKNDENLLEKEPPFEA